MSYIVWLLCVPAKDAAAAIQTWPDFLRKIARLSKESLGRKIVINYLLTSSDIKTETGALPNRIFPTVEGDNNVNFKTDAGGEIAFNDVAFSIVPLQQWV